MADQHHSNKPTLTDTWTAFVTYVKESLEFHKDVISQVCQGWSNSVTTGLVPKLLEQRSKFVYNGGAAAYTVKVEPGVYYCKDKMCLWTADITTDAIDTPAASDWYYLYLDYSAITSWTAITDNDLLVWDTDEPVWNDTYKGYYHPTATDDRCIFACYTNSGPTNILEFFHDGSDYVNFADHVAQGGWTLTDTFADQTAFAPVPSFSTKIQVSFNVYAPAGCTTTGYANWRTNGQSGSTGHRIGVVTSKDSANIGCYMTNSQVVFTDSSHVIEAKYITDNATCFLVLDGWYFPIGM